MRNKIVLSAAAVGQLVVKCCLLLFADVIICFVILADKRTRRRPGAGNAAGMAAIGSFPCSATLF